MDRLFAFEASFPVGPQTRFAEVVVNAPDAEEARRRHAAAYPGRRVVGMEELHPGGEGAEWTVARYRHGRLEHHYHGDVGLLALALSDVGWRTVLVKAYPGHVVPPGRIGAQDVEDAFREGAPRDWP